jgi:hypothetical protein
MLNSDERDVIKKVYAKFVESDTAGNEGWSDIDENMSYLAYLTDAEVIIEAAAKIHQQKLGNPRCNLDHPTTECFVPTVLEAADIVIDLYTKTGHLPNKNRFLLEYYLTLSFIGYIVS